jgi:hypothetical protein
MPERPRAAYRDAREAIAACLWSADEIVAEGAAWPILGGYPRWARDAEVGLVERHYVIPTGGQPARDRGDGVRWKANAIPAGLDGSAVACNIAPDGSRLGKVAGEARINSYGDSFTHGEQVNDGETWQEYLGAHFAEPIRNFGLSGGSVYQTYLRMVKEESGPNAAPYVLFYIWGTDHLRSIIGWTDHLVGYLQRGLAIGNPWIAWDPATATTVERPPWIDDPTSLDRLGDIDWLGRFADDIITQLVLYGGKPYNATTPRHLEQAEYAHSLDRIERIDDAAASELAAAVDLPWSGGSEVEARALLDAFSLRASIHVIDEARRFGQEHGKHIMFLLLDPFRSVRQLLDDGIRWDQPIVDHLTATGSSYFDMTQFHVDDIRTSGETFERYLQRYYVDSYGHYSPAGNHFFAFAVKPRLVEWLDPAPLPYRDVAQQNLERYVFNGSFGAALQE